MALFFSLLTAFRALLLVKFGLPGGAIWFVGSGLLLVCATALRWWGRYLITPERLIVRNGYTGRDIEALGAAEVGDVVVQQGPIAQFFGIGTVVVRTRAGADGLRFRGVTDPDIVRARILALKGVQAAE